GPLVNARAGTITASGLIFLSTQLDNQGILNAGHGMFLHAVAASRNSGTVTGTFLTVDAGELTNIGTITLTDELAVYDGGALTQDGGMLTSKDLKGSNSCTIDYNGGTINVTHL